MKILSPIDYRKMLLGLDTVDAKLSGQELVEYHSLHRIAASATVLVPNFWAATILAGLQDMKAEFPQMRFGSILESKGKLRLITIPTHRKVEGMVYDLCNEIDDLILDKVNMVLGSSK
jgi:hypothetical protein